MNDKNFDIAFEQLIQREGGYTDGKNQISDQPTNMGITQTTLNNYLKKNPTSDMPHDVKYLTMFHARTIYKDLYWDNTKIPQIESARVRNAVFDMSVMSGPTIPTKTLQQTLNEYISANLPKTGYLGNQTIKAINSIPANMVNDFMTALIENRMHSLQKMSNWATAKNGWTRRTMGY
ncbi:MAG: glycosyl hydrolase 108 family protein [Candidatus Enterousia sp.]